MTSKAEDVEPVPPIVPVVPPGAAASRHDIEADAAHENEKILTDRDVRKMDIAMEFLATHGDGAPITDAENKRVLRKVSDSTCSPSIGPLTPADRLSLATSHVYDLLFAANVHFPTHRAFPDHTELDKSALANSSVFGLSADANLVGQQYSWLGSILYLAQLVCQPSESMSSEVDSRLS